MKNIGCFNEILQVIEDYGLTHVLGYQHPWNKEIILQFYATLYISGDESDSTKWIMESVTKGKRIKCSAMDFVSHFDFPRFEHGKTEIRVHNIDAISDEDFRCTMDEEKTHDNGPPLPEHLTFDNQTLYHILTYMSAGWMNTNNTISDVLRNTIHAISQGFIFNVEDMFLRILKDSSQFPFTVKVFAPWIQKVIDHAMGTVYL